MQILTSERINAVFSMALLIEALRTAFSSTASGPPRQLLPVPGGAGDRLMLVMPALAADGGSAVKIATVFPDNSAHGLPTIHAAIIVFSAQGVPTALLDGTLVTRLRTGAASALASSYLSRGDSEHLVIIGTGALAPYMAWAHCEARPIRLVTVCGRAIDRASQTAAEIRSLVKRELDVRVASSIEDAVRAADIVSCCTNAAKPVLHGAWLRPGTFVDLVGSFSPHRREADDEAVQRSRIFVDTFEGTLLEAGDLLDPLGRGIIRREQIEGELADLVSGRVRGRAVQNEIILFKSVGTAIEDLAACRLLMRLDVSREPVLSKSNQSKP
jgi:ornithine cyclodeaminase